MRRFSLILSLLWGLMLAAAFRAAADTPADNAPGWVIILAADYKGPNGELYKSVQSDAQNAVITAANDWGVPADHIILLAEGTDIEKFAGHGTDNFSFVPRPKDAVLTGTMLSSVESDQAIAPRVAQFRTVFPAPEGQMLPYFAPPTATNFKIARDVVARLAQPDQFVAMIVSCSRAKPDPQSDYPDSKLMALPKQMVAGKIVERDCLTAADCAMPGCKARYRVMLVDSSNPGAVIKDALRALPPAVDLGGAVTPWDIGLLEDALGMSGDDHNAVVPIVMLASDKVVGSLAQTDPAGTMLGTGSVFLRTVFDQLRQNKDLKLKDCFEQIRSKVDAKGRSQDLLQTPAFRAPKAADLPVRAIFSHAVSTGETLAVSQFPITGEALATPDGRLLGILKADGLILVKMPAGGGFTGPARAQKVADRMNQLRAHLRTWPDDLAKVRARHLNSKTWVVEAPIADRWVISIDPVFAQMSSATPAAFAQQLAATIRKTMNVQGGLPPAPDLGSAPKQYLTPVAMFDAALQDYDNWVKNRNEKSLNDARDLLERAVYNDASFVEAYFKLAQIYIAANRKEDAVALLDTLYRASGHLKTLSAAQKKEYQQLRKKAGS